MSEEMIELAERCALFPPSRRSHGIYRDEESARDGAYNLARLLNGVPMGYVLYTAPRMGAWVVCSCRHEEMIAWQRARAALRSRSEKGGTING